MKHYILSILISIVCFSLHAESTDSIAPRMLEEVVVLGDRGWIEDGVINVIPSKSEKKLSNSPATLIKAMHLPFVKEKDGEIVSISGEAVPVFINGERADKIDLETFWPKEVKRVQYMENPSEPGYEGAKVAINFIMPKYEVGGVSRVNLFQKVPNNGFYRASSKLVYKKMTYGFLFSGDYYRDHRTQMTGEDKYTDIFYDQKKYETIERTEESHSYSRTDAIQCAFNAKYSTDKTRLIHTISLGWNRNPGSGSDGYSVWSENLFNSSKTSNYFESSNLSPQISGNYQFMLSDKWYLAGYWLYSYARNKNSSVNQMGDTDPIHNSSFEDVNSGKLIVATSYIPSNNWFFQFRTACRLDWYSTLYKGSTNTDQNQSRQEITSTFKINWTPIRSITASLEPGVSTSLWQIGNIHQHTINPTTSASIRWNPTRKFSINGRLSFYMRPTSASESNPVIVKTSELLWLKGNPYLENLTSWDTYISSTYFPKNWLTMFFGFGYVKTYDNVISTYTPAPIESGGLIKETINAEPTDNLRANMELRGSFFDDNLSIGISPQWYYTYVRGAYHDTFSFLTLSGSADYTMGDFRVELWYEGPYKDLSVSGMERSWKEDNWNASLVYGNNNLYLSFRIEDLFNNKKKSWIKFNSPNYSSTYNYWETGRRFSINLTYTFGYGKKVDKGIDISTPESVRTSVLQTQ